jgi:hypothetical protein
VRSTAQLDPERYLGELPDLPASARAGEWCTVVVVDGLGEMRWTLVAREVERTNSLFVERTPAAWGTDGSLPARQLEGGVNRSAAEPVLRGT